MLEKTSKNISISTLFLDPPALNLEPQPRRTQSIRSAKCHRIKSPGVASSSSLASKTEADFDFDAEIDSDRKMKMSREMKMENKKLRITKET